ncbi:hypothetical protein L596_024980 [Steinernema carpocapsae]|uniref:BTB domain-containing protein n=1 Tax=Steinernema carpocapsae TaxID=34508 RepID=A0A4U5M7A3_STECR|nr:hypothetical protein L596_024980 [Steinernema carpocapsae]
MTNKGVIPFKFTDAHSQFVEIGDFEWKTNGSECGGVTSESDRCSMIGCYPKKGGRTVLYSCLAMGTLAAVNKTNQFSYHLWNGAFGNNFRWFCVHYEKQKVSKALAAVGHPKPKDAIGEVYVEIVDSLLVDLSDPENKLIEDFADAAKVKIEGHQLWLSKKVLGANSPFFAALFKNHFKRGTQDFYDVKDLGKLNLEKFLQFIGIVHGLQMPIDGASVGDLLELAVFFQCKMVLRHCENFLRTAPVSEVSLTEKLLLADHFKLNALMMETVYKMSNEELRKLRLPSGISPLVAALMAQKFRFMDP